MRSPGGQYGSHAMPVEQRSAMGAEMDAVVANLVMAECAVTAGALCRRYLIALQAISAADRAEPIKNFRRLSTLLAPEHGEGEKNDESGEHQRYAWDANPTKPPIRDNQRSGAHNHATDGELEKKPHSSAVSLGLVGEVFHASWFDGVHCSQDFRELFGIVGKKETLISGCIS